MSLVKPRKGFPLRTWDLSVKSCYSTLGDHTAEKNKKQVFEIVFYESIWNSGEFSYISQHLLLTEFILCS